MFGERLQDLSEGGPAVGGGGREVGPAVHRLQPGGQEHAKGPATTTRRSLQNICEFFYRNNYGTLPASDPDPEQVLFFWWTWIQIQVSDDQK